MTRKTVIVISTALAVATLVLATLSFLTPLWWDSTPTDRGWRALEVDEGYVRVLVFDMPKLRSVVTAFRNAAPRFMGDGGKQPPNTDAASFAAAFRTVFPKIRQGYKQNGLSGELPAVKAVSFRSWREWSIWGLAVYSPRGHFAEGAIVPLWMPMLVFATYPTIAVIHGPLRRHRRRKRNLCVHCGYNLTGNTSGVCPECGESTTTDG